MISTVLMDKMNENKNGRTNGPNDFNNQNSILKESALLTTVSGFLFGFLLNISINTPKGFTEEDSIILMIALFCITFAISLFVMPVVYHHLQYPYTDLEKYRERSHRFIIQGIISATITLYLGLVLGLDLGLKLGFPSMNTDYVAFLFAAIPFIFTYLGYRKRK